MVKVGLHLRFLGISQDYSKFRCFPTRYRTRSYKKSKYSKHKEICRIAFEKTYVISCTIFKIFKIVQERMKIIRKLSEKEKMRISETGIRTRGWEAKDSGQVISFFRQHSLIFRHWSVADYVIRMVSNTVFYVFLINPWGIRQESFIFRCIRFSLFF